RLGLPVFQYTSLVVILVGIVHIKIRQPCFFMRVFYQEGSTRKIKGGTGNIFRAQIIVFGMAPYLTAFIVISLSGINPLLAVQYPDLATYYKPLGLVCRNRVCGWHYKPVHINLVIVVIIGNGIQFQNIGIGWVVVIGILYRSPGIGETICNF